MSTFFKGLMRVLAAAGATAAVTVVAPALIAFFRGPVPPDVPAWLWGPIGTALVFVVNWAIGKIKLGRPEE